MLWPLAGALKRAGYRTIAPGYPSRTAPLDRIVDVLAARIAAESHGVRVHFVAHSMGGLVARSIIARHRPAALGRVVMLGTPHAGSEWVPWLRRFRLDRLLLRDARDLLHPDRPRALAQMLGTVDYPLGIIAGDRPFGPVLPHLALPRPNDGKVAVASTRVAGQSDHIVLPVSHTTMVWDREVHRQIVAFLQTGLFAHARRGSAPPTVLAGSHTAARLERLERSSQPR